MKIKNNPGGIVEILEERNPVRGESGQSSTIAGLSGKRGIELFYVCISHNRLTAVTNNPKKVSLFLFTSSGALIHTVMLGPRILPSGVPI